jgi:hypothetical protein
MKRLAVLLVLGACGGEDASLRPDSLDDIEVVVDHAPLHPLPPVEPVEDLSPEAVEAQQAQKAVRETERKLDELIVRLREAHPEVVEQVAVEGERKGRTYDIREIGHETQAQETSHAHAVDPSLDSGIGEAAEEQTAAEEAAGDDKSSGERDRLD